MNIVKRLWKTAISTTYLWILEVYLLWIGMTKEACFLSTIHGTGSVEVRRRGDDTPFPKPTMIDEYNNYMSVIITSITRW